METIISKSRPFLKSLRNFFFYRIVFNMFLPPQFHFPLWNMFTLELPSQEPSTATTCQSVCSISSSSEQSNKVFVDISLLEQSHKRLCLSTNYIKEFNTNYSIADMYDCTVILEARIQFFFTTSTVIALQEYDTRKIIEICNIISIVIY